MLWQYLDDLESRTFNLLHWFSLPCDACCCFYSTFTDKRQHQGLGFIWYICRTWFKRINRILLAFINLILYVVHVSQYLPFLHPQITWRVFDSVGIWFPNQIPKEPLCRSCIWQPNCQNNGLQWADKGPRPSAWKVCARVITQVNAFWAAFAFCCHNSKVQKRPSCLTRCFHSLATRWERPPWEEDHQT